jgi:hypothetical protein
LIGGGIGLEGAIEGIAIASIVNHFTRKSTSSVETTVHLKAGLAEILLFHNTSPHQFSRSYSRQPSGRSTQLTVNPDSPINPDSGCVPHTDAGRRYPAAHVSSPNLTAPTVRASPRL